MTTPDRQSPTHDAAGGRLETSADGRLVLRYERRLAHPPERVWRAITEPEELGRWFPAAVDMDPVTGGRMRFTFLDRDVDSPDGRITMLDPPRVFAFDWGGESFRFELVAEQDGCLLVFTNTLDDRSKLARVGAGWHLCLDVLEVNLDGRQLPWKPDDRWTELYTTIYKKAFD